MVRTRGKETATESEELWPSVLSWLWEKGLSHGWCQGRRTARAGWSRLGFALLEMSPALCHLGVTAVEAKKQKHRP